MSLITPSCLFLGCPCPAIEHEKRWMVHKRKVAQQKRKWFEFPTLLCFDISRLLLDPRLLMLLGIPLALVVVCELVWAQCVSVCCVLEANILSLTELPSSITCLNKSSYEDSSPLDTVQLTLLISSLTEYYVLSSFRCLITAAKTLLTFHPTHLWHYSSSVTLITMHLSCALSCFYPAQ